MIPATSYKGALVTEMTTFHGNPNCPCCKKQNAGIKGAMHTKAQWKRYHPIDKDKAVDPLVKSHK